MVKKRIFRVKLERKPERIDRINRSNFRRVDDFSTESSTCQKLMKVALIEDFFVIRQQIR